MSTTKQFNLSVEKDTLDRLDLIAESSHMSKTQLASVALGVMSEIEPKLFLAALGDIKARFGKRRGAGRPPSGPRGTNGNVAQAA